MKDLVRSQFYTLRREMKILVIMFVSLLVVGVVTVLFEGGVMFFVNDDFYGLGKNMTASTLFGMGSSACGILAGMYVLISTAFIAGSDMTDKTVNYDIMYGHTRKNVYRSRVIVTLTAGTLGGLLMFMSMPLIATLIWGWGTSIAPSVLGIRLLMLAALFLRVTAEIVFLTSMVRKLPFIYIAEGLAIVIELSLANMFEHGCQYVFPMTAVLEILSFKEFSIGHLDYTTSMIFDAALPVSTVIGVTVSYLLVAAICLYLGEAVFERSDMD